MRRETTSQTRAILPLIEQLIMLLVFMIAAAVCVRAFVYSDSLSKQAAARDRAMELCRNTAEAIKHHGGEPEDALSAAAAELDIYYDGEVLVQYYNADWTVCAINRVDSVALSSSSGIYRYCLTAQALEDSTAPDGLCQARLTVTDTQKDGEDVFSLTVAWQKEAKSRG